MSGGLPIPKPAAAAPNVKDPRACFSKETIARFDAQVKQYPTTRSALIPILHYAQEEKGWISRETIEMVAVYLKLAPIQVWEVATFYPMFHLQPVGRHVAWVCRNISCDLRGCNEIIDAFHKKCGVAPGQTTADGKLTLRLAECLGGCAQAPVMDIDGTYYENLTPEQVGSILDRLK
ncbi:MAG: NADH-quinone oxidoreductase subunit NuoE [Planctomycetes bacterium]|nr:NADH-quinone oxidoreductase subunit NuoE [Planctomycetota bacterium]